MPDIDQHRGVEARGVDHPAAGRSRAVRIGRTAVTGWALASVLVVAGFGTAMGATPIAVAQPVTVADTTDTSRSPTGAVGLDPLALLPTADPVSPSAVLPELPNLPTIGPAPAPTATESAAPQPGAGSVVAPDPTAQLRQTEFTTDAPDVRAASAIKTALAQIGLPYIWGGNGPTNGDAGFDCSGLTTFSYASAGVPLPRTAHTQYNAGPHVPDGAPLQPGDLVFYGTTAHVHHVGMYLGAGRMVNAPTFGKPVQVAFYRYPGDDYVGATRPAASPGSLTSGFLPYFDPATLPAVPRPAAEQIFTAPTAPMVALPQPGDPTPPEQVSAAQSVQEAVAVSVQTAAARSAAVAGTTTSTSAPIATQAATDPATVGVATSTTPSTTTSVAGTTTSTTAPVTSTATTVTEPARQVVTGSSTATTTLTSTPTPPPATTKAATPSTKKAVGVPKAVASKVATPKTTTPKTTVAPVTTVSKTTATPKPTPTPTDDTSTAKAVKTTAEDDATTSEKSSEKSTEEKSEKSTEKSTESDSSDSSKSDSSDSSDS
jgi:cell wall-associated NlpC family hydrolase